MTNMLMVGLGVLIIGGVTTMILSDRNEIRRILNELNEK